MVLDRLPTTPNGKIDTAALPAVGIRAAFASQYEAPRDEIERALATIWQELLHLERIGRHDNFFELGGHSLSAAQMVSRIRQVLGRELALHKVFAAKTLAECAEHLRAAGAAAPAIVRVDRQKVLPVSVAQERLCQLNELGYRNTAAYHQAIRMRGELDREAFRAALDAMVARHEILRTTFRWRAGSLAQKIAPGGAFALSELDFSAEAPEAREARARALCDDAARQTFDLSAGPLVRGWLVRLAQADQVLIVAMHGAVFDAWSLGIMIRETAVLYNARRRGESDPLAPLSVQYADFAAWQRDWLQGDGLQKHLGYWIEQLRDAPRSLVLPLDKERPAQPSGRVQAADVAIGASLTKRLKGLSRQHNVSLFMTLFAGFALLLSRLAAARDVVIAVRTSGRSSKELESMIGPLVNVLPLRIRFADITTVGSLLRSVRETVLGGQSRQGLPIEWIVQGLQQYPTSMPIQLFSAEFAMQDQPRTALNLDGMTIEGFNIERAGAPAPLSGDIALNVLDGPEQIACKLNYSPDSFESATLERWAGQLVGVFEEMVDPYAMTLEAAEAPA